MVGGKCLHDEAREGDEREGAALRHLVPAGDEVGAKGRDARIPVRRDKCREAGDETSDSECSYSSSSSVGTPAPLSRKAKAPPWTSAPIAFGSSGAVAMIVSAQSSALSSGR